MKLATNENILGLVSAIRETASRMEGLAMLMQDFAAEPRIVQHGKEVEDAAMIAISWCREIEIEYGTKTPEEIPTVMAEVTHAMSMHMGGLGDKLMNFIIESRLFHNEIECGGSPEECTITIWSANAAEQIEAFVMDHLEKTN